MQDTTLRVPYLSTDLIKKLEREYPNESPKATDSEREIWMKAGASQLVTKLKKHLTMDEEDATEV